MPVGHVKGKKQPAGGIQLQSKHFLKEREVDGEMAGGGGQIICMHGDSFRALMAGHRVFEEEQLSVNVQACNYANEQATSTLFDRINRYSCGFHYLVKKDWTKINRIKRKAYNICS